MCPVLVNIICQRLLVEMSLHRPAVQDQLEVKGHRQCDVTKHGHGSYYRQKSELICIIIYYKYKVNIIKYIHNTNVSNSKSIS